MGGKLENTPERQTMRNETRTERQPLFLDTMTQHCEVVSSPQVDTFNAVPKKKFIVLELDRFLVKSV